MISEVVLLIRVRQLRRKIMFQHLLMEQVPVGVVRRR
jgi:hypothetical protein